MPRATAERKYGKPSKLSTAERLFAELPQSPVRLPPPSAVQRKNEDLDVDSIADRLAAVQLEGAKPCKTGKEESHGLKSGPGHQLEPQPACLRRSTRRKAITTLGQIRLPTVSDAKSPGPVREHSPTRLRQCVADDGNSKSHQHAAIDEPVKSRDRDDPVAAQQPSSGLRILSWDEVCPPGDRIVKIAEASYAEVYRITNDRGTSIIKVMRLLSPIKPQTKTQKRAGLIDEEPHAEEDVNGELQISEWLADIPGFVVYKERYLVQGKATRQLLETHQVFQRRTRRKEPDRAQFYPSPSRYLDGTRFLVVELGDAGTALEDWELTDECQLWDIFLLEAIALARAEDLIKFEHRDLHEGNLCVRRTGPSKPRPPRSRVRFGYSGLDITILDYGLSRAQDPSADDAEPVAFDLEKDLSLFASTHAAQCDVYRRMRSHLLWADRRCIPPEGHKTPYARGVEGPLSWTTYAPYTNVLWLAYLYRHLIGSFKGDEGQLARFKKETSEMWAHLDPDADEEVPCFRSAADIVHFAAEDGWVSEAQLLGPEASMVERGDSIIVLRDESEENKKPLVRRSPRRRPAKAAA